MHGVPAGAAHGDRIPEAGADRHETLRRIASARRGVNLVLLAYLALIVPNLVLLVLGQKHGLGMANMAIVPLMLSALAGSVLLAWRLHGGLAVILAAAAFCVPPPGVIVMFVLSRIATRRLRAAGYETRMLHARRVGSSGSQRSS